MGDIRINSEELLNKYIRPYIHSLVELCLDKSKELAHVWIEGREINYRAEMHYEGDFFAYAQIYLSGFKSRHKKDSINEKKLNKEFEQFVYIFEMALKEFSFFAKDILSVLKKAANKIEKDHNFKYLKKEFERIDNQFKQELKELRREEARKRKEEEKIEKERWEQYLKQKEELEKEREKELIRNEKSKEKTSVKQDEQKICSYNNCNNFAKEKSCHYCSNYFCKQHWDSRIHGCRDKEEPNKKPELEKTLRESTTKKEVLLKPENKKDSEPIKSFNKKSAILFCVMGVIILICIGLFMIYQTTLPREENVTIIQNVTEYNYINQSEFVPINISFEEDMSEIVSFSQMKSVGLKGFLQHSLEGSGNVKVHMYLFVDDFGNRIEIIGLNATQKNLFERESTTKEVYELTGVLKRTLFGHGIELISLNAASRDTFEVVSEVEEEIVRQVEFTKINIIEQASFSERIRNYFREMFKNDCSEDKRRYYLTCIPIVECTDGTLDPECSDSKPYRCINGTLEENAGICGCPSNHRRNGEICEEILRCTDSTEYGVCSKTKPNYCTNGKIISLASVCGCPRDFIPEQDNCVSKYETGEKTLYFNYNVKDEFDGSIELMVYKGLNDYLAALPRSISYSSYEDPPSRKDFIMRNLNNDKQEYYLLELVAKIEALNLSRDDKARVAISLVQNIPYDVVGVESNTLTGKYPYEVIYTKRGVCGEKSELLAFILKELGFGVANFIFDAENHASLGIKCSDQYDYRDTGYCFVESTAPTIITYKSGRYVSVGYLNSMPEVVVISDGYTFESVEEEYLDGLMYEKIMQMGSVLSSSNYNKWEKLMDKYGLETS